MSSPPDLKLDWCSFEAAKHAVTHWHYSRTMPSGKLVKVGVWEDGRFVGAVIFGRGANNRIGSPYKLGVTEVCELVRVALRDHKAPVSRIASIAIRMLKRQSPGLKLIVSYADPMQGHVGGIYQAMGWLYVGVSEAHHSHKIRLPSGEIIHKRTATARYGTAAEAALNAKRVAVLDKHKYLWPLTPEMRAQLAPLCKPYHKRAGSAASGTSPDQGGRGGATPTPALSCQQGYQQED